MSENDASKFIIGDSRMTLQTEVSLTDDNRGAI